MICDAQIHAPHVDPLGEVNGIDELPLLAEMNKAGVDRAVIVPLATKTHPADNTLALDLARRHPARFRVMGLADLQLGPSLVDGLADWLNAPGMAGMRVSCYREPFRSMFVNDELDWLWSAAEANSIPIMLNASEMLSYVSPIAQRHPKLRLAVDHLGVKPHTIFDDLSNEIKPLLPLATHANVSVKASAIPCAVPGPYPFSAAYDAVHQVVRTFGSNRVFWGSDLTRLPCSYGQAVTMFTEELDFLTDADREWIMGRALSEWLDWPIDSVAS